MIWVKAKESQYLYVIIKLWFLQFLLPFKTRDAINKYFNKVLQPRKKNLKMCCLFKAAETITAQEPKQDQFASK